MCGPDTANKPTKQSPQNETLPLGAKSPFHTYGTNDLGRAVTLSITDLTTKKKKKRKK